VAEDLREPCAAPAGSGSRHLTFFVGRSIFVPGPHSLEAPLAQKAVSMARQHVEESLTIRAMPSEHLVQMARKWRSSAGSSIISLFRWPSPIDAGVGPAGILVEHAELRQRTQPMAFRVAAAQ